VSGLCDVLFKGLCLFLWLFCFLGFGLWVFNFGYRGYVTEVIITIFVCYIVKCYPFQYFMGYRVVDCILYGYRLNFQCGFLSFIHDTEEMSCSIFSFPLSMLFTA